jgi:toxin ParE1/3/4
MKAENRSVRLSPLAEYDLETIWTYTASKWSVEQADRYVQKVFAALQALSRGDCVGRSAAGIRLGYLKYAVGRHFLFFKLTATHLDVIRILHQRMDIEAHIAE